ncbi:MAG: gamma-glutamylcyclotransferase [Saprospiraceae bacterium]
MNLFVYGTLMRGMPFPIAAFLEQNAVFGEEGWLPGRLYDLGGYPGLVYLPQQQNRIYGHVFGLTNPEMVLAKLDAYEMYYPEAPERSEYLTGACAGGDKLWIGGLSDVCVQSPG